MKRHVCLFLFLISFIGSSYAQTDPRINTIKNQLSILKVESPGLEETININITQSSLANFLLAISKVHNININVSPELNDISIVNNFSNVTVADILIFLVKEYDLDIDFTGNILSIKKFVPPPKEVAEKVIQVDYNVGSKTLSLDLKNDRLDQVFRKIMDLSGKNLLYRPEIESTPLTIYINNVPFDLALEKLAESNNLLLSKSRDGFYVFDSALISQTIANGSTANSRPIRKPRSNFYYKVLDTVQKQVAVDFQNTPIADVIYTIGADLNLDIFTASPLDQAGVATVTVDAISFDVLLNKIFQSSQGAPSDAGNPNSQNRGNQSNNSTSFTYKKEGQIYYFGTEDQLSLKQVELVPMMHRSVQLLSNPSGNGQRRAGRNSFNSQQYSNYYGNTSNYNPTQPQNQRYSKSSNSGQNQTNLSSIEEIIPDDIVSGLDIKIDAELNSFVVSGPGIKVERFKDFITYIDKPVPMILIEVMILEVNRSATVETGVSFGLGEEPSQTQGSVFPSANIRLGAERVNRIIGNFNGFGSLNLGNVLPEFYLDIQAMESNGNIKVLSTPKLSTINGHKAYLSSGVTSYYAVTTQNFFGSQIPVNSEITNYVPIDAELALEIMPFVSGDGEITLDVQVIQSTFNGERIAEDAPPGINSREFSSIIRMRDQDVAILGGIEEVRKDDSGSGVPLLARIPVIKWLFSKRRREDSKRKLNILIKPTVIH